MHAKTHTCISFKDSCGEISYSLEWICANGLHVIITSIIYTQGEKSSRFTFISNGWLNKFDWILNVSYTISNVSLWNFTRSCLLVVDFSVNSNGRRFLCQRTISNRNKKKFVRANAPNIDKWNKKKILIADLFIRRLRLQVRIRGDQI